MPFDCYSEAVILIEAHARYRSRFPIRKNDRFANQNRLGLRAAARIAVAQFIALA